MTDTERTNDVDETQRSSSRRKFLMTAGLTAAAVGVGGVVYAQQGDTTTFVFDGVTSGWQATAPSSIAGTTNPTLSVTPGEEYEIRWTNADGEPHNIAILDANGNVLHRTELITSGSQTLSFTAEETMSTYLCEAHPSTMVGQIDTSAQGETGVNQSTNQTTQVENVSDIEPQPEGPLGEREHRFVASLSPAEGIESDATGMVYVMVYASTGGWARLVYQVTVDNVDPATVTDAHIRLSRDGTEPIVAPLYETDDVTSGVLNRSNTSSWARQSNSTANTTNASMNTTNASMNTTNATNATNATGANNSTAYPAAPVLSWGRTLSYGNIYANEFSGPLEGNMMIVLVNAMNEGSAFAQIHTEDYPDGLLRGSFEPGMYGTSGGGR